MQKRLKPLLDMVVSVGALCSFIIFLTIVCRVMIDVVMGIWSRSLW